MAARRPETWARGDSKLRVLFVIPGSGDGASMIFTRREADAVEREGAVVERFFLGARTNPIKVARECARLRDVIDAFEPDVVHAQFGTVTALVSVAISSAPVVITFRGSDLNYVPTDGAVRSLVSQGMSQLAAARAARIVCVSQKLRGRLLFGKARAEVLPNGTDLALFKPMPKAEAREALGWPAGAPLVLFNHGRKQGVKRIDIAQAAVAEAGRFLPGLRLIVMEGMTPPEEVPLMMNAADALLVTSDSEGSPATVSEALACNLPVVSVDVGDVEERLRGVDPSFIVPRDPALIGRALVEVLRLNSRSNGAARMAELSSEKVARRLIALYESARRGASSPESPL